MKFGLKEILFLIFWLPCVNIAFSQGIVNRAHTIDSVYSLSEIINPPNNLEVLCNCDSMLHIYNNGSWHTIYDSAHCKRTASTSQVQANYSDTASVNIDYIKNKPIGNYTNTATTTSGAATFYLTSDKTVTGTALYTTVNYINPVVNDINANYVYSWVISGKTLTVTAKSAAPTGVIGILGISVLGAPTTVVNGTTISVTVFGQ